MECCQTQTVHINTGSARIALVGNPNVGKSMLFYQLTGRYVTVSNYPGTTVEVSHGVTRREPKFNIVDTPGIVSFPARTEDEAVTERVLLNDPLQAIVLVADAKNIRRSLLLTVQLAEMNIPMVVALNMTDELHAKGLSLDLPVLVKSLGLSFVSTIATRGQGVEEVIQAVSHAAKIPGIILDYPEPLEQYLKTHSAGLPDATISPRSILLQWLSGDPVTEDWLRGNLSTVRYENLETEREELGKHFPVPLSSVVQETRNRFVESLASSALARNENATQAVNFLSQLTLHPIWGLAVLGMVLFAFYWFVGVFGSGTLVGLLEENLFGGVINPWVTGMVTRFSPFPILADFLVGEYGIWTIGVTYATALLLPIVTTFFIAFGVLEDSGYLPRLSVLSNRAFEKLGLNGKAILPMVLGLGCVTMATITTRILESKRDRFLVIFLLALAVPCSAQLGVVMGMLAGVSFGAMMIWSLVVFLVLIVVGWIAARLAPGERSPLLVELPPLRVPVLKNVLLKTVVRLEWYVKEAVPLFFLGTVVLFVLDKIHVLPWLIKSSQPLVSGWLGLPAEASAAFLMGFLRRDFAATGLFVMQANGLLSPVQVVVSIVTITLFIPCIASLFMIAKERGWKTASAMAIVIFPLAFLIGGLLNRLLLLVRWNG